MKRVMLTALAAIGLAVLVGPSTAAAHVQVNPSIVSPNDAVKFTVLVPGESDASTRSVELAIPPDVVPFSYGETPGWRLIKDENPDGSIRSLHWRGKLASDGFAEFSFLASTPPKPTTIVWKSIQSYDDGDVVRWIGSAESEYPAARTAVQQGIAKAGAGGTHGAPDDIAAESEKSEDGSKWAESLALAALFLALVASGLALRALQVSRKKG